MTPELPHSLRQVLVVVSEVLPARFFLLIHFHQFVNRLLSRLLGRLQLPDRLRRLSRVLVSLALVILVPAKLLVQLIDLVQVLLELRSQYFLVLLVYLDVLLHLVEPRLYVFALLLEGELELVPFGL